MRLLYVEDDPHHADLAVRRLWKAMPNVQVETVSTIREAHLRLDCLASEPLDLVLTDVHLRDGDGLSLLRHIRENSLPLAVVLITGMGDEETAVAALKARADDYVVKGKDYLERLPVILESALNHYRADAARRSHPLNILYIEDELSDVDATRRHFAVHADHLHLDIVFSGREALSALRPRAGGAHYDVILMSFDPNGLNALDVLRELRLTPQQDMPVVLLCREGCEDIVRQGLKLGASGHLVKSPGYLYQLPWELEEAHSRADLLRREAALRASEARNHAILNAIPDLMFVHGRDGTYLDYHARDERLLVLPPEQFLGKSVAEVMPPRLAADFLRCFEQALATDLPVLCEYTLEVPEGVRAFEASIVSCDGDKILSIVRDVTERKTAEGLLRESEARFRTLSESAQVLIWVNGAAGCEYVNRQYLEFLGVGEADVLGYEWARFVHPEDFDAYLATYQAAVERRALFEAQCRLLRHDGEYRWMKSIGAPRLSPSGDLLGYVGTTTDVTDIRQAQEALRESEARLRLAQEAARVGTWEWNVQQRSATLWSEEMWKLLGLEPGDGSIMTLERFSEFIHPEDRARVMRKGNEVIDAGEEYDDEFRIVRRDGGVLWLASKGRVIRSATGQAERMLGVNIDITRRKLAEESLKGALAEVRQLKDRLQEENVYLQEEVRVAGNFDEIKGGSEALKRVLVQVEKVAPADATVLLLGETGTGKELFAHAIHNLSPRRSHTLVKVNCAALPEHLIESELFGHEKGAFTGAVGQRRGRFELADGGTLFLDEVGELPPDLQAKLLRVLEEGEFERVGSSRTLRVNVRLIAATNRRLEESVREGAFRSDLYYRLSVYPVRLPPLRERREDIPALVSHFVKQLARKMGKEIETVPQGAMAALQNYDWPGNIRELRNVIERAVIITRGASLRLSDDMENRTSGEGAPFPGTPSDSEPAQFPAAETLEQSEYNLILRTLKRVNWKVEGPGGAAQLLDIHPSTLRTRMRKLGITRS